ncbi:hypothetical protein CRX72_13445 [Pantoea sp. BRM17]|nr:hypothetical protein CRX72_13445 [Pantoea sp. BRM17]
MSYSGRSLTDKMIAMILPVAMFVGSGFEHSIANMFLIPMAILIRDFAAPEFWQLTGATAAQFPALRLNVYIGNLCGALFFVMLIWLAGEHMVAGGAWGLNLLQTADHKMHHSFIQAVALGTLANLLVCLAVTFVFYITATTGSAPLPWGIARLIGGICFSLGLMLVVVCGADLFTSTVLIVVAKASGRISWLQLARHPAAHPLC